MAVSTFGLGTPITSLAPSQIPWGLSPSSAVSVNPLAAQQLYGQSPFAASTIPNPYGSHPIQQVQQLLQIVPQQLQHLLQLQYLQQHQLQQLHQILQLIPAQLQQLVQFVPQHIQQAQPFAQFAGAPGLQGPTPWGVSPQIFGAQPNYVM
jgi:hypothetical protein